MLLLDGIFLKINDSRWNISHILLCIKACVKSRIIMKRIQINASLLFRGVEYIQNFVLNFFDCFLSFEIKIQCSVFMFYTNQLVTESLGSKPTNW